MKRMQIKGHYTDVAPNQLPYPVVRRGADLQPETNENPSGCDALWRSVRNQCDGEQKRSTGSRTMRAFPPDDRSHPTPGIRKPFRRILRYIQLARLPSASFEVCATTRTVVRNQLHDRRAALTTESACRNTAAGAVPILVIQCCSAAEARDDIFSACLARRFLAVAEITHYQVVVTAVGCFSLWSAERYG